MRFLPEVPRTSKSFAFCPHSQQPELAFTAHLEGVEWAGTRISAADTNGNVYIVGSSDLATIDVGNASFVNNGGADIILYKLSPSGEHVWTRTFGGSGDDIPVVIATGGADGVYIVGKSSSSSVAFDSITLDLSQNQESSAFIVKLDASSGDALWGKVITGNSVSPTDIAVLGNHNILYVGGGFGGEGITVDGVALTNNDAGQETVGSDGFLLKVSADSGLAISGYVLGGNGDDALLKLVPNDNQGSVYFAGFSSSLALTLGGQNITLPQPGSFIARLNPSDDKILWVVPVTGTSTIDAISVDMTDSILIVGSVTDHVTVGDQSLLNPNQGGQPTGFLAKLYSNGQTDFVSPVGMTDQPGAGALPVAVASDNCGRIIIGGSFSTVPLTIGNDTITELQGPSDAFLTRFSSEGTVMNVMPFGGEGADGVGDLSMTKDGHLIIVGTFALPITPDSDNATNLNVASLVSA